MTYYLPSQTCLIRYKYNNKTSGYFAIKQGRDICFLKPEVTSKHTQTQNG